MASLGVVQAPCHGASRADSADQPRDLSAAVQAPCHGASRADSADQPRDLSAAVQAPCHGASRADSADQPRDLSATGHALGISTSYEGTAYRTPHQGQEREHEPMSSMNIQETQFEEDQPYCQAYNLILTGRWMMAVPRSKARFDSDVAVNGLGNSTCKPLNSSFSILSPISYLLSTKK
jgi:hypothetical protein